MNEQADSLSNLIKVPVKCKLILKLERNINDGPEILDDDNSQKDISRQTDKDKDYRLFMITRKLKHRKEDVKL